MKCIPAIVEPPWMSLHQPLQLSSVLVHQALLIAATYTSKQVDCRCELRPNVVTGSCGVSRDLPEDLAEVMANCGEKVHSPSTRSVRRARSINAVKNFVSSSVERTSE
jgi:hypothetical protein